MPDGDTQVFTQASPDKPVRAPETIEYSHVFKLSIKAFIAVVLIVTVCLANIAGFYIAIHLSFGAAPNWDYIMKLLTIGEPLYTMSGMALAYYFGQQKQTTTTQVTK